MLSQLKAYLVITIGFIVTALGVAFKMRGSTIEQLKKDKVTEQANNVVLKDAIAENEKTSELREKYEDITEGVNTRSADDRRERLRNGFQRHSDN